MNATTYEKIGRYIQYLEIPEIYSEHRFAVVECGQDWAQSLIELVELHRDLGHVGLQGAC